MTSRPEDLRLPSAHRPEPMPTDASFPLGGSRFDKRLMDARLARVAAGPAAAFAAIERIGGANGWYASQALWDIRGWLDLIVGGVGMGRGRRDQHTLVLGDVVDCWRVEAIERCRLLRLVAEMKLPGRAWLEFEVRSRNGSSTTEIRQTAIFDARGLAGQAYWYAVWPLHVLVFAGMLRGLVRYAEGLEAPARRAERRDRCRRVARVMGLDGGGKANLRSESRAQSDHGDDDT